MSKTERKVSLRFPFTLAVLCSNPGIRAAPKQTESMKNLNIARVGKKKEKKGDGLVSRVRFEKYDLAVERERAP